jgi:hypothetical protein
MLMGEIGIGHSILVDCYCRYVICVRIRQRRLLCESDEQNNEVKKANNALELSKKLRNAFERERV